MAYDTQVTQTAVQTSGTTYAVTLGTGIVAGDLIFVYLSQDGSATSLGVASSGFTAIGTQAASGAASGQGFFKIAAGGETTATFACANDDIIGTAIVFKDTKASTPFGSVVSGTDFHRTDWNASATSAIGSGLTLPEDDCLLIYAWSVDAGIGLRCKASDLIGLDYASGAAVGHIVGVRQAGASGAAAPTVTMYAVNAAEGGNGWVFCIRNASSGSPRPYTRITADESNWYGNFGAQHTAVTLAAASNFDTTIAGVTASTTIGTVSTLALAGIPVGTATFIPNTDASTVIAGGTHTVTSEDLSGKIVCFTWSMNNASTATRVGSLGVLFGLYSSANNYSVYQVCSKDIGWGSNETKTCFIELGSATVLATGSSGGCDFTDITRRGFFYHRTSTDATSVALSIQNFTVLDKAEITGGGSTYPAIFAKMVPDLTCWGHYKWGELQGSAQVLAKFSVSIGNGTNKTYFDGEASSFEFPPAYSTEQNDWNVGTSQVSLSVNGISTDTILLAAGVAATSTLQTLTITSGSNTVNFAQSFVGWGPTWKTGVDCENATFSNCDTVAFKGAEPVGVTVKNLNDAVGASDAACSFDTTGKTMTGCTTDVTGSAAGYHIELGTSVTAFTLANHTFTGSAATNKVHVLATTGTVTITISGTTVLDSGSVTSEGAAIDVSAPTVTADISITGMLNTTGANNRLQIINTTAVSAASRANSTAYSAGDIRLRQTGIGSENTAGLYLRCTTSGTSAGSPPTWNTTVGGTTTDGTAVWTTYAVLYYDADPAATSLSDTYIDGEEFKAGEVVEIRFAEEDPGVSFNTYSTSVVATADGFSALVNETADDVYASYALSGATYDTTFSPNYTLNYIVLDTNTNFSGASAFAYYCYLLTTSDGMYRFWGGLTALDTGNIRNNTATISMYFDESAGFVRQTDDVRIFRDDGARPAIDPTSGGAGIEINWRTPVNVVSTGGSALTTEEHNALLALPSASTVASTVLTSAQSTPIYADARKMNGATITGTGVDSDLWRGA